MQNAKCEMMAEILWQRNNAERGVNPTPFRVYLSFAAVIAVGGFRHTPVNDGQRRIGGIFQRNSQGFFFGH